jgi:hypothetical protein
MSGGQRDPFLGWLHGLYLGQPSDRQRWLAWVAMVSLMIKAPPMERRRWHRYFARLSAIESDRTMSESDRGQAFMDLIKEARPTMPDRGRPRNDVSGLLRNFPEIEAFLARAWTNGEAAKRSAVREVERAAELKLDDGTRGDIVRKCRSPRVATIAILAYAYEQDPKVVEQALYRARRSRLRAR